jgi:hypothetical protein
MKRDVGAGIRSRVLTRRPCDPSLGPKMRRHRIWFTFGTVFVFAVGVGYLVRPDDELAGMLRLHPSIDSSVPGTTVYFFSGPPSQVLASLPGTQEPKMTLSSALYSRWGVGKPTFDVVETILPSGREAFVSDQAKGCEVCLDNREPAWYWRAWSTIRFHLRL